MYVLTPRGDSVSVLFRIDDTRIIGGNGDGPLMACGRATMRLSSLSDEEVEVAYRALVISDAHIQPDEDFVERRAAVRGFCVNHDSPYSRMKVGIEFVVVSVGDRSLPVNIEGFGSQHD